MDKAKQIYKNVLGKIKAGTLQAGEVLPSTREVAQIWKCHRLTALKVYQDLCAEGWISTTERKKYRVLEQLKDVPPTSPQIRQSQSKSILFLKTPQIDLERKKYDIAFWGGQPDLKLFPKDEFRRVLSAALRRSELDNFNYGMTQGLPVCVKEIKKYLRRTRDLKDKDILMTQSSQDALLVSALALAQSGDQIAIEQKGYPPAWRLFEKLGLKLNPIPVDEEGLQTQSFEKLVVRRRIKFVYLTPLHQYPTTVALSPRRRQHLIQLCEFYHIPILEDDYDHEFHFTQVPPEPLATQTSLALYLCSFSKIIFPGLRLGLIAADKQAIEKLSQNKFILNRQTDSLSQIGLAAWMKDGGFEKHLWRCRRVYQRRYFFLLEQLKSLQKTKKISWIEPNGGMSVWLNLHQDSKKIAANAMAQNVLFQYESALDYKQQQGTHLRMGFAGVTEAEIERGLDLLKRLI